MSVSLYQRPLPKLHFKTSNIIGQLKPFDTTITSSKFNLSFTFNCNQKAIANKFSRLCSFILFRLRNYFFSRLENPLGNYSQLLAPLSRIINEIISDYNSTSITNVDRPLTEHITNSIGIFTNLNGPFSDFPTFLDNLRNKLNEISQTQLPESIFDLVQEIFDLLDVAICMVYFFLYHVYPLSKRNLTPFNTHFIIDKSFLNFKRRLGKRIDFSLIDFKRHA